MVRTSTYALLFQYLIILKSHAPPHPTVPQQNQCHSSIEYVYNECPYILALEHTGVMWEGPGEIDQRREVHQDIYFIEV